MRQPAWKLLTAMVAEVELGMVVVAVAAGMAVAVGGTAVAAVAVVREVVAWAKGCRGAPERVEEGAVEVEVERGSWCTVSDHWGSQPQEWGCSTAPG